MAGAVQANGDHSGSFTAADDTGLDNLGESFPPLTQRTRSASSQRPPASAAQMPTFTDAFLREKSMICDIINELDEKSNRALTQRAAQNIKDKLDSMNMLYSELQSRYLAEKERNFSLLEAQKTISKQSVMDTYKRALVGSSTGDHSTANAISPSVIRSPRTSDTGVLLVYPHNHEEGQRGRLVKEDLIQFKKNLTDVIKPQQNKVRITRATPINGNGVALGFDDKEQLEKVKQIVDNHPNYKIESAKKVLPRILVKNVPMEMEAEELKECIQLQNDFTEEDMSSVKAIVQLKGSKKNPRTDGLCSWVLALSHEMRIKVSKKGDRLAIGLSSCAVASHVSMYQCFFCLDFGHSVGDEKCCKKARCMYCTGEHESRTCVRKADGNSWECYNCKTLAARNTRYKDTKCDHGAFELSKCQAAKLRRESFEMKIANDF